MGQGAAFPARGGFGGGFGGRGGFAGGAGFGGPVGGQGRHLYITGVRSRSLAPSAPLRPDRRPSLHQLPYTVGWQDLKDLFRAAGSIIRADVKMGPDGSHSGTGTVVYETAQDAQNAIGTLERFSVSLECC